MRLSPFALLALTLALLTAPLFAQGPSARTGDEIAIRAIVQKYVDARESQDPKAIERCSPPTPINSSPTGRGGRVVRRSSGGCSNRRGRTRHGGP